MDQVDMGTVDYFTITASVLCVISVANLGMVVASSERMPRVPRALALLTLAGSSCLGVITLASLPLLAEALFAEALSATPDGGVRRSALYGLPIDLATLLPVSAGITIEAKQLVGPQVLSLVVGLVLYAIGAIATPRVAPEAAPRKARLTMSRQI